MSQEAEVVEVLGTDAQDVPGTDTNEEVVEESSESEESEQVVTLDDVQDVLQGFIATNPDVEGLVLNFLSALNNAVLNKPVNTELPVIEEAAAPVVEESAAPVVEEAAAPVVEEAAAPVVEEAAAPVVEEAAAPVVEESAAPVVEEAAAPVVEEAAPVLEEPATPMLFSGAFETSTPVVGQRVEVEAQAADLESVQSESTNSPALTM